MYNLTVPPPRRARFGSLSPYDQLTLLVGGIWNCWIRQGYWLSYVFWKLQSHKEIMFNGKSNVICSMYSWTIYGRATILRGDFLLWAQTGLEKDSGISLVGGRRWRGGRVWRSTNREYEAPQIASNPLDLCSVVWPYQMSFKKLCARSNPVQPPSGFFVHYIWSLPAFLTRVSSINYDRGDGLQKSLFYVAVHFHGHWTYCIFCIMKQSSNNVRI